MEDAGDSPIGLTVLRDSLYFSAYTTLDWAYSSNYRIFRYHPEMEVLSQITDHESKLLGAANGKLYYSGKQSSSGYYKLYEITIEEL